MVNQADVAGGQASACTSWGDITNYKSTSLDTIPQPPKTTRFANDNRNSLTRYSDLDGASPRKFPHSRICSTGYSENKVFPHSNRPMPPKEHIDKSEPAFYFTRPAREMMSLTTKDIAIQDGGASHPPALKTPRVVDPVMPVYKMATAIHVPPPVPKFIRDSIDCSDINCKAQLSPRIFLDTSAARPTSLYKDDIEGTTPRQRTIHRHGDVTHDVLNSDDVSRQLKRLPWKIEETTRHTNPLEPEYHYNIPKGAGPDYTYGKVDGIKATRFFTGAKVGDTPGRGHGNGDTTYRGQMFITSDIEGATVGTKGRFMSRVTPFHRTQFNKTNDITDMQGAAPNGAFSLLPKFVMHQRAQALAQSQDRHLTSSGGLHAAAPQSTGGGGTPRGAMTPRAPITPMAGATPREGGSQKGTMTPRGGGGGTPKSVGTPRALNNKLLAAFAA